MGRNNQQRRRAKAKERTARRRGGGNAFFAGGGPGSTPPSSGPSAPTEDEVARHLVATLMYAVSSGHAGSIQAALTELEGYGVRTPGRQVVARVLGQHLRERLDWAWEHGWHPADLLRMTTRSLGSAETALLGDAIVTDLTRYAEASVDRRWFAQLREAGAQQWWSADLDFLRARAERSPAEWTRVCERSAHVLLLLSTLPELEPIGPRPGEATGQAVPSEGGAPVQERILTKVRQLLAKAESTTFEAEAETFTAGAQAMMARHSIDAAMVQASAGRRSGPQARRIGIDRPYESPKAMLLGAVADANRCRTVWSEGLGFMTVLGFENDLEAVETLFTSLLVQSTQAMQREGSRRTRSGASRTRSFRSSFLTSYAARIGERLLEVTEAETAAASGEGPAGRDGHDAGAGRHTGGELVRVLAERSSAVDEAVEEMFPELIYRRASLSRDLEGWASGRAAADRASLDTSGRVDRGPASQAG